MSDLCKCGHRQHLWPHHEEWIDEGAVHTRDKCESVGDVIVALRSRVAEVERDRNLEKRMRKDSDDRASRLEAALRGLRLIRWKDDGSEDCWCVTDDSPSNDGNGGRIHETACDAARAALAPAVPGGER